MARRDLKWFATHIEIPGAPVTEAEDEDRFIPFRVDELPKHHEIFFDALQAIADDQLFHEGQLVRNVMALWPPGSAKSTCLDVIFAPWFMARNRNRNVILACYGADLARKQSRRARALIRSQAFQSLFPEAAPNPENFSVDEWSLMTGGEFMTGGILTGITGNRTDFLLVDDPIKNRQDADSDTIRNRTWEEYLASLCTRAKPGMRKALSTTRWHEDDPAGRLLPEDWDGESGFIKCRDNQWWLVLRIPAQCDAADDPIGREIGEYLWEGYQGEAHYAAFKNDPRTWSALFQGRPAPDAGLFFDVGCVQRVKPPPKNEMRIIAASDFATKDGSGDYTVHIVGGIDKDDTLHVLDMWRRQTTTDVWIGQQLAMGKNWEPLEWGEPRDLIQKSIAPQIEAEMSRGGQGAYFYRVDYPVANDKPTKARVLQGKVNQRKLAIAPDAPFANEVISEMVKFPAAKHDDIVDALALLAIVAAKIGPYTGSSVDMAKLTPTASSW